MLKKIFHMLVYTQLFALFLVANPAAGLADEDTAPPLAGLKEEKKRSFSTGTDFFDDAAIGGGLFYFQRKRERFDMSRDVFSKNLNHATFQAAANFDSGFVGGILGLDLGVYTSIDLYSDGAPDHEMNFVPWADPWHPDWGARHTQNGVSLYKAHLKAKFQGAWLKAGYFQPSGPGVLGVNWSILPGTYLGAETGFDHGGLSLAGAFVRQYKAPWYDEFYRFEKNDRTRLDGLWSVGARYSFPLGFTLEAAAGASPGFMQNAHLKAGWAGALGPGKFQAGYHLYVMTDSTDDHSANDLFAGTALQHFVYTRYDIAEWTMRAELTYTLAPQDNFDNLGYFAYRLVVPNGGAKGAYEAWWDQRSDWNHDRERAVFGGIWRTFGDLGLPGLQAGLSASYGWGGKAYGYSERLRESAWSLDLGYTLQKDYLPEAVNFLGGSSIKAHFTRYYNHTDLPSWVGFKNAFQNEKDFKLFVSVPFNL